MSGYRLLRFDCNEETQRQWALWFPGCGERPLLIPDGNARELLADFVRQGGSLPNPDAIESESGDGQWELFE